mmetsp:Transcript_65565/g.182273  ORF Transcript_65565/g.182273 Transcript_65565/m.182273 type:complete len:473 (+) Transcript_65565:100-1518(+)
MLDPLAIVNELVVIVPLSIALVFLWRFRDRVLLAVTGDDRLHASSLDLLDWLFLQCCGGCTGEWSRHLTGFSCIPKRFRNRNLVKMLGQVLGVTGQSVELKNIVLGDLPLNARGDFFLQVEYSSNPPLVTSLAEDQDPKVIHFPEVLTMRIKHSCIENQVRVVVREMKVWGSRDLCELRLSPVSVLEWAYTGTEQTKRFILRTLEADLECETPPWILLQFDSPTEARGLETLHNPNTVRTATQDGAVRDATLVEFKDEYALLDPAGYAVQEPPEVDLMRLAAYRSGVSRAVACFTALVVLVVSVYMLWRFYVGSCYSHFEWITIAQLHNVTFPVSTHDLSKLVHACYLETSGTGLDSGIPCRPSAEQTAHVCRHVPERQPRPTAFRVAVHEHLGLDVPGIPCASRVCALRNGVVVWDRTLFSLCVLALLSIWLCRHGADALIRRMKRNMQRLRMGQMRELSNATRAQLGLSD